MESLYLFITLLVSLGINALQLWFHYREKEDIFKKFMARDLHESEFFKHGYKNDLKEKKAQLKHERENPPTKQELEAQIAASKL